MYAYVLSCWLSPYAFLFARSMDTSWHLYSTGFTRVIRLARFRQPRSRRWVFQNAYTTSCRDMLRALGTSNEKVSCDSYRADIHKNIKKLTLGMKLVSDCIIISLSLGMSRVALENHSKRVAFLWKPPRYGCGWMLWKPGRPSVARTTEVANKRSNKLTLYAWCQRLGWKKGEDIQILPIWLYV